MAITIGTLKDYVATAIAAYRTRHPKKRMDVDSFYGRSARAVAMSILHFSKALKDLDNESPPGPKNSDGAANDWAAALGIPSNNPTSRFGRNIEINAQGGRGLPGCLVSGTVIPAGSTLIDPTGQVTIQVTTEVTTDGPPNTAPVSLAATNGGEKGNLPIGTVLTWDPAIPNVDTTLVLTAEMAGGKAAESTAELTARNLYRLQNPPRSGAAADFRYWCENWMLAGVRQTSVKRAYPYANRGGTGTHHTVVTGPGSGLTRQVVDFIGIFPVLRWIETYVNSVRPVCCAEFKALSPDMQAGRGMFLSTSVIPFDKYSFDFDDRGLSIQVTAVVDATHIEVSTNIATAAAAASLKAAIDLGKKPRLQIRSVAGLSVLPIIVEAIGYTNAAASVVTLAAGPSVTISVGDAIFAGGPVVLPIAQAQVDLVDRLGPSKQSGYADEQDSGDIQVVDGVLVTRQWDDTLRISALSAEAQGIRDADKRTPMVREVVATLIDGVATNRVARDNLLGVAPELLWVKNVIVIQA